MEENIRLIPNIQLEIGEVVDLYTNGQAVGVFKDGQHIDTIYHPRANEVFARRVHFKGIVKSDGIMFVRFAPLHDHSFFSLLDGMISPEDRAKYTEYYGALTDHGNMYGFNRFDKAMRKNGKHPILGCEVYCEQYKTNEHARNHLVLLAETTTGLHNIIKICTNAWDNLHKRPHVTWEDLRNHSEGVICLTACAGGEIPRHLNKGDYESAVETTLALVEIFGANNVFLEAQRHEMEEEVRINEGLERLSKDLNLKMVATTDSHYAKKENKYHHEIQLCIRTGSKITDEDRFKFPGDNYYMHSSDEMVRLYADHPEWLDNTLEIAERCRAEIKRGEYILPEFPLPEGFTNQGEYLEYLCIEGFKWRYGNTSKFNDTRYHQRLRYELDVVLNMGFPGYFVIVSDFIMEAKRRGILVGPGRGSAAGSLIAYVTGITDIDPIEYDLLFERFLNPDRVSMPDIDVDFQDDRRDEVIDYVKEKYGADNVSKIVTFGRLAAKVSFRDVARTLIESKEEHVALSNRVCKLIPNKPGMTLEKALNESPEFKVTYETDAKVREIVDIAKAMEGMPRQTGVHACFDETTLVTTYQGLKPIKDVQTGDLVLTHNNRFKPVVATMTTKTDMVYTLKGTSSFSLDVTGNHPMYVRELVYKKARSEQGNKTTVRLLEAPQWVSVESLQENKHYIGISVNQEASYPVNDLGLPVKEHDFWWIVGRYLGDCWVDMPIYTDKQTEERYISLCCDSKSNDMSLITKRLDSLGLSYKVKQVRTTEKIDFVISKEWETFLSQFGTEAYTKELTGDVLNLPKGLLETFFDGYMSSNGSLILKEKRYTFKTISKKLAIGLSQIVNKVYHRPVSTQVIVEESEQKKKVQREKYNVTFTLDKRKMEKSFYEDGYIWTRVAKITTRYEPKTMYNLTVLDDSSYVAHGLIAHNCGVIVTPKAVKEYIPQIRMKNSKTKQYEKVTQITMGECEELGLLKMDFLGLRTLGVMSEALRLINRNREEKDKVSFDAIPIEDVEVYEYLSQGNTGGVFQLESDGMTNLMKEMYQDIQTLKHQKGAGRECFERLVAGISLYRPGPLDEIPNYVRYMLNPHEIHYDIPQTEKHLKNTYSVITYQEQVMAIVRDLAGFSAGDADVVRKGMGKKNKEIIDEYGHYFVYGSVEKNIPGCVNNGISEQSALALWEKMAKFGEYALI